MPPHAGPLSSTPALRVVVHKTYLSIVVEVKLNLYELYFFKYAVIRSFRLALSEDMYLTVPKTGRSGQGRS